MPWPHRDEAGAHSQIERRYSSAARARLQATARGLWSRGAGASANLSTANDRVDPSITETYKFLPVPMQDAETADGLTKIVWEEEALSLSGSSYAKAIETATREKEWVIKAWAPTHLAALLAKWFWKDERPSVRANKVWLDTCRYLYMPRLASSEVFVQTIRDGVQHKDWFAYAAGEKADGGYQGVLFGRSGGGVYLDDQALLVRPEVAEEAQPRPEPVATDDGTSSSTTEDGGDFVLTNPVAKAPGKAGAGPATQTYKRFHGTVELDGQDPIGAFSEIVSNVIEQFSAIYGTQVTITVDIEARRKDKFDLKLVRVVRENAATLKFKTAEFEED